MYSLDINFLNDRTEYKSDTVRSRTTRVTTTESRQPLILGLLAAVLLPGIAFAMFLYLQNRNAELAEREAALNEQLGALKAQQAQVDKINAEVKQVKDETQALVSVFNQIKPWSALTQDLRDRIPPGVRVNQISQTIPQGTAAAPAAVQGLDLSQASVGAQQPSASPSPGASPAPSNQPQAGVITIDGEAKTFNDVNDFLLVLQNSNFLDPAQTRLVAAELGKEEPLQSLGLQNAPQTTGGSQTQPPALPPKVKFTVQTALRAVPASELLRELDRKGAAGLVTRIETLQQKGVIQQ